MITKKKYGGKKIYKMLKKDQFFNNLFGMGIEGMIEFIIYGYLNVKTAEIGLNGEIMGI